MGADTVVWSSAAQQRLRERVTGRWAEDVWRFQRNKPTDVGGQATYLRFTHPSPAINLELKYALSLKFESGQWGQHGEALATVASEFRYVMRWLTQDASPATPSLLAHSLDHWERSLRRYLVARSELRQRTHHMLTAAQEYQPYVCDDARIRLFRQIYMRVAEGYDDRAETEKDRWDLRALGITRDFPKSDHALSFTRIVQPWLRDLAKRFMQYNIAVHSVADCQNKMNALNHFSRFLVARHPWAQIDSLDRALFVDYLATLRGCALGTETRRNLLGNLRIVLEVCAHRLDIAGLPRDRLIFDDEMPLSGDPLPREIPEGVLAQLRQHLDTLPTTTMRMVVILLECGLRIGELCTLPVECIFQDSQGRWYLAFYQHKLKQEHSIPLVDDVVVATIQAQQDDTRARHGAAAPYLFPSTRGPRLPYRETAFGNTLNRWAVAQGVCGPDGRLWRFESHQFRHTAAMRLLSNEVPLDTIRRLLGHRSLHMTERYARKRADQVRAELERAQRGHVTIDAACQVVQGDARGADPDLQLATQGLRSAILPIGGCGRLRVLGPCEHENKCITCPFWRTSTGDLPQLDALVGRGQRLLPMARQQGNTPLVGNLERILPPLEQRITALRQLSEHALLSPDEQRCQGQEALAQAEAGLAEARSAGVWLAVKTLEQRIDELRLQLRAFEWEGVANDVVAGPA